MVFTSILVWKKGLIEDQFVLLLTPLTSRHGSIADMSSCVQWRLIVTLNPLFFHYRL